MNGLPQDVADFIVANIDSVGQLEVLLLLFQNRNKSWGYRSVSAELRTSDMAAHMTLAHLHQRRLVEANGASPPEYRFPDGRPDLEAIARALAQAYQDRRVTVISSIYSKPERPTRDPVRLFADSFKLKRNKDDDNG